MKRFAVLFLFIVSLASAIWIALSDQVVERSQSPQLRPASRPSKPMSGTKTAAQPRLSLEKKVQADFQYLRQNKFLGFKDSDLADVQVLIDPHIKSQPEFQKIADVIYAEFPKSNRGSKRLEVTLISGIDPNANAKLDVKDEIQNLLVLQFSLVDMKSQNKTWEMGRTYSY